MTSCRQGGREGKQQRYDRLNELIGAAKAAAARVDEAERKKEEASGRLDLAEHRQQAAMEDLEKATRDVSDTTEAVAAAHAALMEAVASEQLAKEAARVYMNSM